MKKTLSESIDFPDKGEQIEFELKKQFKMKGLILADVEYQKGYIYN